MDEPARFNRERWEELSEDEGAAPGTWHHFRLVAPPSFEIWCALRPDVLPPA